MAAAKSGLSELASRASAGERFVLLRRGKPVAGLVGPEDVRVLESTAAKTAFLDALDAFRRRHRRALATKPLDVRRSPGRRVA